MFLDAEEEIGKYSRKSNSSDETPTLKSYKNDSHKTSLTTKVATRPNLDKSSFNSANPLDNLQNN